MKGKAITLTVFLLCFCLNARGRQINLTIENLFTMADSTGLSIEAARMNVAAAENSLQAAKRQKLPSVNVSASVGYLGNGYVWERDFTGGMPIDIPHFGNNFAIEAVQVIYAGGALRASEQMAEHGLRMADVDYQKERQDLMFALCGCYLDLFKTVRMMEVYDQHLALTDKVIDNLERKQSQGVVLKNDLTRYELMKEKLLLEKEKLENARFILNMKLTTALKMEPDTEIVPQIDLSTWIEQPTSNWVTENIDSSLELQKMDIAVEMSREKTQLVHSEMLPTLAVFASEHLDGPVTIEVPVLNNNFNYWCVGMKLSYEISSLYKGRSKVRSAEMSTQHLLRQQAYAREQVETAATAAYRGWLEANHEVDIQERSLSLARDNYQVVSHRYQNDLALLTDILDASQSILSSELSLKNAQVNRLYHRFKLKYICGNILK